MFLNNIFNNKMTLNIVYVAAIALVLIMCAILLFIQCDDYKLEISNTPNHLTAGGVEATYQQAYLDPPNLLQLPPLKRVPTPNELTYGVNKDVPMSMYKGGTNNYGDYTPDLLWCKKHL